MITLSSYNKFQRNCHRDAVIIAISNSVTSFFSGFVVFSILGYMAHISGKEVKDVFAPGPGLAFIVYPEVVSRIPGSQVWAALFFLMLITLALGSIFGAFETVITALSDQWPGLRAFKPQLVLVCSAAMLVLGLPFSCNGGVHMFTLFDASAPSWNLLLFALLEVVLVSWVYGVETFLDNMAEMNIRMSPPVRLYWKLSWKFTTPLILVTLLVFSWRDFGQVEYNGSSYPLWVQVAGYLITGGERREEKGENLSQSPRYYFRLHPGSAAYRRVLRGPEEVRRHHPAAGCPPETNPAVGPQPLPGLSQPRPGADTTGALRMMSLPLVMTVIV